MISGQQTESALSAAFFCPQSRAPHEDYLSKLHSCLQGSHNGQTLLHEVAALDKTWLWLANAKDSIRGLSQGPSYVHMLVDWSRNGHAGPLAKARSGIVALPLLVILQIGQYLQYLERQSVSHQDFMRDVRGAAGLQGYCAGLATAIAIACSRSEAEVVKNAATVIRILLGVGAYGEAADESSTHDSTTLALRLKYENQGDELARLFPGTYVSAITDPKSVSMVGPAQTLVKLYTHVQEQGLAVQKMDIRGKVHNPENRDLAADLCDLCSRTALLQLPEASSLQVPLRSNLTGERLLEGSLTEEIITTILASKCDWHKLLSRVAKDLEGSDRAGHKIAIFGMNDCVPMGAFHKARLRITKVAAHSLIQDTSTPVTRDPRSVNESVISENAIAITGASCRLPGANSIDELWKVLSKGRDCHREISTDRFSLYDSFRASQSGRFTDGRKFFGNFLDNVDAFDNSFFGVNIREAINMDPQQRLLLELSYEALEASGYLSSHRRDAGDNVGCFIGASLVEYLDNTNAHGPTAYTSTGTIRAFLCGRLSYHYGWRGPSEVVDTACSSSLVAINRACKAIQAGECDMALAGGVNVITGINNYLDLGKAGFLSPTGQCKPFDSLADGYCRSEGAGLVVLKRLTEAIRDGDQIMGVISGVATNQGGLSTSLTVPSSSAQEALYSTVLRQAGLQPSEVTYVEAHGPGTPAGDPIEMRSIRSVFGSPARPSTLYVGSIKGNIGHCETAAGVAGLLKVLAMIMHGAIAPQANHQQLNTNILPLGPDRMEVPRHLCAWTVPLRAALVTSYGAAGSNCALLCCEPSSGSVQNNSSSQLHCLQYESESFPILLSAATRTSLSKYSRKLAAYLQQGPKIELCNVAFTLNERRRRHKFGIYTTATNVSDLIKTLESPELHCLGLPQKSKPIVLVFSGQSSNTVSLDKTFYNNYAVFRNHIEACDLILKGLGYSSFYPAIFEHAPISDVVLLQCSIFAVQYAVARSWIDAGLKIDAMIGHSLGEVTALAVSEVLSLADCIKLVACRAHFTKMKWGAEKGAMLAIHATSEEANEIIKLVQPDSNGGKLEIACYNASSSVVVVGPTSLIHATETLLRTDTHFQRFRSQRLNTSHGFHSYLTEPILAELDALSRTLQWCDPKIPIEVCRLQHLETMQDYSVSKHAREPVFFADAVWRVEDRLGPCVWFEAGIDTSIIPLVRKASRTPDGHDFQSLSTRKAHVSAGTVTDATLKMWRNGVFVSHWGFLPVQTGSCKQIWLPPYQFDVASHWLANIDRPSELMRQSISSNSAKPQGTIAPPSPQLVFRKESTTQSQNVTEFGINTDCQRFRELVRGHAVRQRPLCPASMYMECVTMAAQILLGELSGLSLDFESLMFQTALGLDPTRETILILEELAANRSWRFTIRSCTFTGPKQQILTHACGKISLTSTPRLELFQRLIWDTINQLDKKVNVEKLMSKRAYGLFAHVVHYEPFYRGISAITLDQSEAVATAKLPEHQPGRSNTTAWRNCDTPTIDTFIQVVGLLMNSSDLVSEDQVMVAVGIDRVILSSACDMSEFKEWRVYAKFAPSHDSRSVGDVFVCSQTGEVVALLSGCRFTKLLISKLEKSLDSVNLTETPVVREPLKNEFASVPRVMPREAFTPDSESLSSRTRFVNAEATALSAENDTALRRLISGYTGLRESDVAHDISLAELGLDSLSSVEMIDELTSKFGMEITSDELITATLETLLQRIDDAGVQTVSAQAQACHKNSTGSSIMENSSSESSPRCIQNPRQLQRLLQIIADASGVESSNIQEQHTLADLGVDSLSAVDMTQQLEDSFSTQIESSQPVLQYTVKELTQLLNLGEISQSSEHSSDEATHAEDSLSSSLSWKERDHICLPNPFEALIRTEPKFETAAKEQGFTHYWTTVSPLQDKLLLAYIIEGFRALGVDLSAMQRGTMLTPIPHLPKYDKLMRRLLDILASHEIVVKQSDKILRGGGNIDARSSLQLYETFSTQHPRYESEAKLMDLTGPKLAECLSGEVDPISLMFAKSASLKIMENFYGQSPMMSTLTKLLVDFLILLLVDVKTSRQVPVRILEVGAGTGGTTMRLAKALEVAGISALYTFTDISPSLVSKAKEKLTSYPWISFSTFNLENDVTDAFRNQFDIVISTNCVHATTDRTVSCRRLRETLKEGGLLVLSEVTRFMDWYDICFGLLDGWWLAEGRSAYPLQEASAWMSTFRAAGFKSMSYSRGSTPEAMTQQLLVGSNKQWEVLDLTSEVVDGAQEIKYHLETMVYKEVSNVQIHADVYIPETRQDSPMPFALMIHGGGHMTLSRRAIRPAQTKYLLSNGFLPVSVDYRLCPEISLIEGPFADVRDAYWWVRTGLAQKLHHRGIFVDSEKVVIVGWSTGGHLAMSIGWTTKEIFMPPPTAILSFYAPTDFESGELDAPRMYDFPERQLSISKIKAALQMEPITNYGAHGDDTTNLGWVKPGDPRSELVLSLFKEGTGLPLLLKGLSQSDSDGFNSITTEDVAAVSPLAQVRRGRYQTPTYIVHGTDDEIVPFVAAERFAKTMSENGVRHGFLKVQGAKHIHDLQLRPGMGAWEAEVAPGYQFLFDVVRSLRYNHGHFE